MTRRSEIEVRATSPSSERRNALTVARYLHTHDFTIADVEAMGDVAWAGVLVAAGAGTTYRDLVITKLAALTPPADAFDRSTGLPGPFPKAGAA